MTQDIPPFPSLPISSSPHFVVEEIRVRGTVQGVGFRPKGLVQPITSMVVSLH
ncbi:hypothetical protein [Allocoleopsis franciscana]|uniref:Acylphosphatase n=1 Tax=Allocoleopsis franciscana PCC 7113 TaxID=1173027 RepID=K9WI04_9CYAN|nr:hypothetical protein [Allocoleopsis franciscana]AFZ19823.1 hypothetical protein Mic7113_4121 [Allocoleopsis franciscana PCC 7113]